MMDKIKAAHALKNYPDEKPLEDRHVNMSNALARAAHGLTLAEKRLIMAAVSKMDSRRAADADRPMITKITAAEYAELSGLDMTGAYRDLAAAGRNLFNRSIKFFSPHFKRNGKPAGATVNHMRWVGRATYHKQEGWLEVAWWPEVLPHLTGLKRQFTQYKLQQATALRSVYSWKLLELLQRFKGTGWAVYTIEDFCMSMDCTEKQQANFNNVKRRIIEPAVKELMDKDGWVIDWIPVKSGRRVTAVKFKFRRDPQGRLF